MDIKDKIYLFLYEMREGTTREIDHSNPNAETFIEVVKEFIDNNYLGGGVEFSKDFKFIKKYTSISKF